MFLDVALLSQCSPQMDHAIAHAIIKTESELNPNAIGVNSGSRLKKQPTSYQQALPIVKRLLRQGKNIDVGLGQINSSNFRWLKLSPADALNPCTNVRAMQKVFLTCYEGAGKTGRGTRVQRAFSCYNTGNYKKGFTNGYVNKVTRNYNKYKVEIPLEFQWQLGKPSEIKANKRFHAQPIATKNSSKEQSNNHQKPSKLTDNRIQESPQPFKASLSLSSTNPDNNQAQVDTRVKPPKKVYASWDVFKEF